MDVIEQLERVDELQLEVQFLRGETARLKYIIGKNREKISKLTQRIRDLEHVCSVLEQDNNEAHANNIEGV